MAACGLDFCVSECGPAAPSIVKAVINKNWRVSRQLVASQEGLC
jgi:hypothetical protein